MAAGNSNMFAWAIEAVPLMSSRCENPNRVWVGTFQLVWNDFMDEIVKGPVVFKGGKSYLAQGLNKREFTADELSPSSYYKTCGEISLDLKKKIETAIKKKFNETSDILDSVNWMPGEGKYLVYAMLKKDFKFAAPFDRLKTEKGVQYFGITPKSHNALREQVTVLFYTSRADFAVKIKTAGKDEVFLYRTDKDDSFEKLYSDMLTSPRYDSYKGILPQDELKIPDINLFVFQSFDDLCYRPIKGTDNLMIESAIETVEFKMNQAGVKLKSEAAIATTKAALPTNLRPRLFYFDDTFVLFLKEQDKSKPYFALRVADVSLINKTGR